ncbi:MAG: ATP-dependent DNA helicase RecG [Candidatus Kaiserbacteria bacterium]|nr:ATP-dependent DNA helicase RecG [Candidatus Kaiserbacteria bacterium]
MNPSDPIAKHFRLIKPQVSALRRLGLITIRDLLYHFPARYETAGADSQTNQLIAGEKVTLYGTLSKLKAKRLWKSRRPATEGWFEDSTGRVKCMWFNQPYIASYVPEGSYVKLTGTVTGSEGRFYIASPEVEIVPPGSIPIGLFEKTRDEKTEVPTHRSGPRQNVGASASLFAVYPESRGVTSKWFYHALERVFSNDILSQIEDPIPRDVRARYNLPDISTSLVWVHKPEKQNHAEAARKRFSFEEIFAIQTAKAQERALNDTQSSFPIKDAPELAQRFFASSAYRPTGAQERATAEILQDFEKPHPMARLLEGDVGSGKTLVAAATAYAVINSRPPNRISGTLQVAYMAPTEILAEQHFQSFIEYFKHLPINIALITGSGCKKFPSKVARDKATEISRSQLLKWVANGEISMLVGTHALIQKSVQFKHLAYAIVDEQHRFGTNQRKALVHGQKSARNTSLPHFLSMTATPIPRTFALTLYGDLDLSVLDELPPGRAKVKTQIVETKEREEMYEAVREELKAGRQAFVVCPRIEEPDPKMLNALQAKSAKAEAKRLQKDIFPEYEIGLLHGAMRPDEKEEVMKDFASGKIQVLVATSVVEVGINVPNATVMMIEGAERFGLAQLHQLRGRIMRSSHLPYCFLLPFTKGQVSSKRLKALEKSDDGFALAEADLEARGAGDLFGRRQWGISDLGMEALKNPRLIKAAREEAHALVAKDSSIAKYPALAERIKHIVGELHSE